MYNFDELICRKDTDALKLEALAPRWGRTDLLPMWVADMAQTYGVRNFRLYLKT